MKRRILAIFLAIAMTLELFFTPPSLAVGNQESDRVAVLTASSPNFEINLYPKPDSKSERLGYDNAASFGKDTYLGNRSR